MKSAKPMPSALPSLTSVRSSSTIVRTFGFCGSSRPSHPEPPGDVRVHRGARDVLAAELDDQHVDLVEREGRHQGAGVLGELVLVVAADVVGREALDAHHVAGGRLDRTDAAEQAPGRAQRRARVEQSVAHLDRAAGVDEERAGPLAEPDDRHLHAARLDRPLEAGVRLDAVDRQHAIGGSGVRVEVHRRARRGVGDDDGVHGRPDLGAEGLPRSSRATRACGSGRVPWRRRATPSPARRTARRRARAARRSCRAAARRGR